VGEVGNAYRILVGKPEGKKPLGKLRRIFEDNILMGHREIRWEVVNWVHLAHDKDQWRALVNRLMNLRIP
jgi:hypothetical protein